MRGICWHCTEETGDIYLGCGEWSCITCYIETPYDEVVQKLTDCDDPDGVPLEDYKR